MIALPLLALQALHASTFQVSLLSFFGWLPYLLFSLPAGAVADRWNQRGLMITCDVIRMLLLVTVPALALAGILTLPYLYAVVGVSGVLTVLFTVAARAQLPRLISSAHLIEGNGTLGMGESLGEMVGPSISGVLIGLAGAARTVFLNVATYAISALALGLIRVPASAEGSQEPGERTSLGAAMTGGIPYVIREPVLRSLLVATCVSNFFVIASWSIEVTFMLRTLHASSSEVGLVFTAGSLGGLVTGAFANKIASWAGTARVTWLSMAAAGPFYLLMPLAEPGWGLTLYAVGLTAMSASVTMFNAGAITYRQLTCPASLLNRVNAVYLWISYGVIPIGSLFGGLLGAQAGLRPTIWGCAVGIWTASFFLVVSPLRRMRDMPGPAGP